MSCPRNIKKKTIGFWKWKKEIQYEDNHEFELIYLEDRDWWWTIVRHCKHCHLKDIEHFVEEERILRMVGFIPKPTDYFHDTIWKSDIEKQRQKLIEDGELN